MQSTNTITVEISTVQALSYASVCEGFSPVLSVCANGLSLGKRYDVSLSIYGIGKNGFFIERTPVFSRRLYAFDCGDEAGRLCFDISGEKLKIKKAFFENLKSFSSGSIYAELSVDGKKYLAQKSVDLLPKNMYSPLQPPSLFAYFLYPHTELADNIARDCKKDPEKLFDSVKKLGFIYSSRNGEDEYGSYSLRLANELCHSGTKVAGALEVAMFLASCAVSCRLYPSLCVTEKAGTRRLLCGLSNKVTFKDGLCDRAEDLAGTDLPMLFDVTALFTGYNIDFSTACRSGLEALRNDELLFFADLIPCLNGGYPMPFEGSSVGKTSEALDAMRAESSGVKSLTDLAELLENKQRSPLLDFDINAGNSLHLCLSSISVAEKLARHTVPVHIASAKGAIDIELVAPLSNDVCSLIAPKAKTDLNIAETNDIFSAISSFKSLLCKSEEDFILSTLLSEDELKSRTDILSRSGEVYVACGFFKILGKIAPIALFPVACDGTDITFTDTVPYANKLFAQHIITGMELDDFHKKLSLPDGSCENIINYFESLAMHVNQRVNKKICEVIRECALSSFPIASCRLSSLLREDCDAIAADPLAKVILSGERLTSSPTSRTIFSSYASRIAQLEETSPALCDTHLAAVAASGDNDILISADNGCGITDTAFAIACENLRLGKKTLIVCPEEAGIPRALKNKFERANLSSALLSLTGNKSIKRELSNKLSMLKGISVHATESAHGDSYQKSRQILCDTYRKDSKIYPFGRSLYDLICEHEKHCAYLSDSEKEIHILPEKIFLPDMSSEQYEGLFESSRRLCEAAYELCPSGEPLSAHPLISVRRTAPLSDTSGFMSLYEDATLALVKLRALCEGILSASGIDTSDLRSLTALFSYVSLVLTVMTEYDTSTVQPLMHCDIYALAKKVDDARALMRNGQKDDARADIDDILREIKGLLPSFSEITQEELDRLSGGISFIKSADLLTKRIFGTDSQKRAILFSHFYEIHAYCNSCKSEIIRIAECFEKLFDEKNGTAYGIYSLMKADIYGAHFEEGILTENGMYRVIKGWKDNLSSLSDIVSFNIAEERCEECGLSLFARYIKDEGVTQSTPHIFARSLALLAANQIQSRDKAHTDINLSQELTAFSDAQKEISVFSLNSLSQLHVSACSRYISSNVAKVGAFSDSLSDSSVGSHRLLQRYCDIITGIFPIVFAHPEYAACLDGFENVIFLGSDRIPLEKALPILPRASHKMICAQVLPDQSGSLAYAAKEAGVCQLLFSDVSYKYDSAIRGYFDSEGYCVRFNHPPKVRRLVPTVAHYDKGTGTNLPEAQSVCLDVISLFGSGFSGTVGIAAFSREQASLISSLLSVVGAENESIKLATDCGRLSVFCPEGFCPDSFDTLYISTLFAPTNDGRAPYCYRALSSAKHVCDMIRKAVSCARSELVVASSLYEEDISGYANSSGMWQILRLCEFAKNKSRYIIPDIHTDVLCESLCDILTDGGYNAHPIRNGIGARVEYDGVKYAVYCEKTDSHTTFDRECSLCDKLVSCGYTPIPVRAQDIMLNKQRVIQALERIIKKEKPVI